MVQVLDFEMIIFEAECTSSEVAPGINPNEAAEFSPSYLRAFPCRYATGRAPRFLVGLAPRGFFAPPALLHLLSPLLLGQRSHQGRRRCF